MASYTFTTVGSGSYSKPASITKLVIECWGGGGSAFGNDGSKNGGGVGGQYAKKTITYPTANMIIPYIVAAGGSTVDIGDGYSRGTSGGDSIWDNGQVVAKGGAAGNAIATGSENVSYKTGSIEGGVGDIVYKGGSGVVVINNAVVGHAGGGGAGSTGNGNDATIAEVIGVTGSYGGLAKDDFGGAGADGQTATAPQPGKNGSNYGGGGGGGTLGQTVGLGAQGLIRITEYTETAFYINQIDNSTPATINDTIGVNSLIFYR